MRWMTWLLAAVLLVGCSTGGAPVKPAPSETPPAVEKLPQTPAEVEQALGERAKAAVAALKAKDMAKLAAMVHPEKGVRFSPYPHVNIQQDVVLKAEQIKTALVDKKTYLWGITDGRGDEIKGTLADYYPRFIYDVDFAAAPKMGWGESIGHGTTIDNHAEVYPQGVMVEYHFPGFDPKFQGMDWRSLRLIFERVGKEWYLVGIIHGQWTT